MADDYTLRDAKDFVHYLQQNTPQLHYGSLAPAFVTSKVPGPWGLLLPRLAARPLRSHRATLRTVRRRSEILRRRDAAPRISSRWRARCATHRRRPSRTASCRSAARGHLSGLGAVRLWWISELVLPGTGPSWEMPPLQDSNHGPSSVVVAAPSNHLSALCALCISYASYGLLRGAAG
jgi:hypothetical protein